MPTRSLRAHPTFPGVPGPVLVVIMDGVGIGLGDAGDAVALAHTPTLDWLRTNALSRALKAHGTAVGLPDDSDMGNSEVGHNALGAGRIFDQGAKRVNLAIASGELFRGEAWQEAVSRVRESGEPLHLIGLLSDGNVHSHIDHLFALLRHAASEGVLRVRVHVLLDGRDVGETSALRYVDSLEALLTALNGQNATRDFRIASGGGRMRITMDRYEADWPMVAQGWATHVHGQGRRFTGAREAISAFRQEDAGVTDQFLPAFVVIDERGSPVGPIRDGASVILFNFRGDRAIEISRAFTDDGLRSFDRGQRPDVFFAGMMQYDGDLHIPEHFLVTPPRIDETMGELLARENVRQLACSETQKFGHVTYFWNGNRSGYFNRETERYLEIPSDSLPFEERPWMKAAEITDATLAALPDVKFARINYPNGDMVGHTGHRDAAVLAVEAVDLSVGRLLPAIRRLGGALVVTADHGNADEMFERQPGGSFVLNDAGGYKPKTSHSCNPVPLYVWTPGHTFSLSDVDAPGLANIAATCLHLLGFEAPEAYMPSLLR